MRRPAPSPNGRNDRGRFAKGNPGGPGNPYARRVADLRAALLESVTEQDIRAVARALVKRAKEGEVPAARELLDRLLGRTADSALDRAGPPVIHLVTGVPDAECDDQKSQPRRPQYKPSFREISSAHASSSEVRSSKQSL
jgi:hypothetical protein